MAGGLPQMEVEGIDRVGYLELPAALRHIINRLRLKEAEIELAL